MRHTSAHRRRTSALFIAVLASISLVLPAAPAAAWYDNNLPPGCSFTATPYKPYKSGGRIYSKVTYTISGCNGRYFNRTHGISTGSNVDFYYPYVRSDARGRVPDSVTRTMSMPCKRGNWATTISLQFESGNYHAFAQGAILSVTSC